MWIPEKTSDDIEFSKKIQSLRFWDWKTSRYPVMASHRFLFEEDIALYRKKLLALAESDISLEEFRDKACHLCSEFAGRTKVY